MSVAKAAARGAVTTVAWQAVRIAIQFVSVVVFARILGPGEIGLMAMVVSITGIGQILRDFGLSTGAVQAKTLSQAEKSNLFWINCLLGTLIAVGFVLLAWPIAAFYRRPELVLITQITASTFVFGGIATQFQAELHRRMRFSAMGIAETVSQGLALAVGIGIALWRPTVMAIAIQQIAQAVLFLAAVVILSRWKPSLPARETSIRHIVRFSANLSGTQILAYLSKNVDNVAIGYWFGAAALGLYSRAFQLVTIPLLQITTPISRVAMPLFSRLTEDVDRFGRYLSVSQTVIIAGASAFYGTLAGLAPVIILTLLGPAWMGAAPLVQVLAIGAVLKLLGQVPYWIFVAHGATGRQFRLYMVGQPVIIAAILLGLPFGSIGVAWGSTIGYAVFWCMQMATVRTVTAVPIRPLVANGLIVAAIVGLPAAALSYAAMLLPVPPIAGAAIAAVAVVAYMLGLLALFPRQRRDALEIARMMRKPPAGAPDPALA